MLSDRLGTARIQDGRTVAEKYPYEPGSFWLGRAEDGSAIGYRDDRHICIVSGTRGGKGTSIIINNLTLWPGSAVIIDPKGENATVTAVRRGNGDWAYCEGMGQDVHVLDPFNAATVDDCYRSSFNPLADLDPDSEETLEEAHRIANAIVVIKDDAKEPIWDESARTMVRGLILHVLSADEFDDHERNLVKVRELIQCGASELADCLRKLAGDRDEIPSPHLLLWKSMQDNPACAGTVARIGAQFRIMMEQSPKTLQSVLHTALTHTEFIDSPGMARVLSGEGRTFKLSELKTRREGMTLYLSLPMRQLRNTHYRWLRMMVDLTITQMEITRGRTATGHPVLMVLDEFKSLRRMEIIEDAAAQIAGFGVKIAFIVQTLAQLHETYKNGWETFLSNAGLKVFFSIDDHFSRDHISKLAGETEIIREMHSYNASEAENESRSAGTSHSDTASHSATRGVNRSFTEGRSSSHTDGTSQSESQSQTEGESYSHTEGKSHSQTSGTSGSFTQSSGWSRGSSGSSSTSYGPNGFSTSYSSGGSQGVSGGTSSSFGTSNSTTDGTSSSTARGTSFSFTNGISSSRSQSDTQGRSTSGTMGASYAETDGTSSTNGTSRTYTTGTTRTTGSGRGETLHKRPLIQPDEVGRVFARIEEAQDLRYPGLALVMAAGADPLIVRRTNYFEDPFFIHWFSPHPDHEFCAPVEKIVKMLDVVPLIQKLVAYGNEHFRTPTGALVDSNAGAAVWSAWFDRWKKQPTQDFLGRPGKPVTIAIPDETGPVFTIAEWLVADNSLTYPGQRAVRLKTLPPNLKNPLHILIPAAGKLSLAYGDIGDFIVVRNYPGQLQDNGIDPLYELRQAVAALPKLAPPQPSLPKPLPQQTTTPVKEGLPFWLAYVPIGVLVIAVLIIILAAIHSS